MELHDYAASANCYKVRLLLAQLGRDYRRIPVDIFSGDTQRREYLARNLAGRTPLLVLDDGEALAESGAILLYLAEGSPILPEPGIARARVQQWLFFEQNLVEPHVGSARFWRLTKRAEQRPEAFARHVEAGEASLGVLDRHLGSREFVTGDYSVADIALYGYVHVAHEAGLTPGSATLQWLERVRAQPAHMNDLEPYPANAMAGASEGSVHA